MDGKQRHGHDERVDHHGRHGPGRLGAAAARTMAHRIIIHMSVVASVPVIIVVANISSSSVVPVTTTMCAAPKHGIPVVSHVPFPAVASHVYTRDKDTTTGINSTDVDSCMMVPNACDEGRQ